MKNIQNKDFIELAEYASKAPSGHNTQPWKFHLSDDTITIRPDFDVRLPVVDGNNRELFISLGCATENLCIAASQFGYAHQVIRCEEQGISIRLAKTDIAADPLYTLIKKRQTNRNVYTNRKIPGNVLESIQNVTLEPHIRFYFAEIGSPFADSLIQYIAKGNEIQMKDQAFKKELISWMRFNKRQVGQTNDGLTYQAFGSPPLPAFISKPVISMFLKPNVQNKSDLKKINSSSHLVMFTIRNNIPNAWISLGRSLQRFLLHLTQAGIANAYMNQPCEVESLAKEIQARLPIDQEFPALILRIGYAGSASCSPRKKVESVIE